MTNGTAVFLQVASLPPLVRPAHVTRYDGKTLVWASPDALRAELAFWAMDNLTDEERRGLREAYGQPRDLGVPVDDDLLDGYCDSLPIPEDVAIA